MTLDTTPLNARHSDPDRILNFRTPRLDLDSVYGRGLGDQPYLYEHFQKGKDKGKPTGRMLVGKVDCTNLHDLPRNSEGRALIGDMRNDENVIVSQIHLAFLLAHNTLVDRQVTRQPDIDRAIAFTRARKTLRTL